MFEFTLKSSEQPAVHHSSVIKVAAKSRCTAVAGAIAGMVRGTRSAEVHAIGAGAVNQAVKALAIARDYLEGDGIDIMCQPQFIEINIDGGRRVAMRFTVESRTHLAMPS